MVDLAAKSKTESVSGMKISKVNLNAGWKLEEELPTKYPDESSLAFGHEEENVSP